MERSRPVDIGDEATPTLRIRRCSLSPFQSVPVPIVDTTASKKRARSTKAGEFDFFEVHSLPSEFCSFDYMKAAKRACRKRSFNAEDLWDDHFSTCFFSGYLDSFEIMQLTGVSKRFRSLASSQVHRLDLHGCKRLDRQAISNVVERFPNLQELDLSYCSEFGSLDELSELANLKSLRYLSLKGTQVDENALKNLLQKIGPCKLRSLDLSAVNEAGSQLIANEAARAIASFCPELRSLRVAWCKNLDDVGLAWLTSKLKFLTELDVSLTGVTNCSPICQVHSQLQQVDLSGTNLSQECLDLLSFNPPPGLERLSLRFQRHVTGPLLSKLLSRATKLKHLNVAYVGEAFDREGRQQELENALDKMRPALGQRVVDIVGMSTP